MAGRVPAMVMIRDRNLTAHQDVITYLNAISGRYMNKVTETSMVSDRDSWREGLVVIPGNGFEPQSGSSLAILTHIDGRQATQVRTWANSDLVDSKCPGDQTVS